MELVRSIVSRLRQYVGDRRESPRRKVCLEFEIVVSGLSKSLDGSKQTRSLLGHTLDVSADGMSLIVPAIRIGDHHLVSGNRSFSLKLQLPSGLLDMEVAPVRYESLEGHPSEKGFLIGVKTVGMAEADRAIYAAFVSTLLGGPL